MLFSFNYPTSLHTFTHHINIIMKFIYNMTRSINRKQRHRVCKLLLFIDIFKWLQTLSELHTQLQGYAHSTAGVCALSCRGLCTQLCTSILGLFTLSCRASTYTKTWNLDIPPSCSRLLTSYVSLILLKAYLLSSFYTIPWSTDHGWIF